MIRRLIILLLIVGCVFGDTIKYYRYKPIEDISGKTVMMPIEEEINGEYLGIYNKKVFVRMANGKVNEMDCDKVKIIIKDDLSSVEWSCSEETYTPKTLTEADIKRLQKTPVIGGTLIAIGGGLLFSNIDKECDDCIIGESPYEEYLKDLESTQKIGYGFIILGGILLALGI